MFCAQASEKKVIYLSEITGFKDTTYIYKEPLWGVLRAPRHCWGTETRGPLTAHSAANPPSAEMGWLYQRTLYPSKSQGTAASDNPLSIHSCYEHKHP